MTLDGRTALYRYSSSPAGAWPETCTRAVPWCTTCAPSRVSPLITAKTAVSLPGMSELARITVSSGLIRTDRWSPLAIRASADSGSPCEPVET